MKMEIIQKKIDYHKKMVRYHEALADNWVSILNQIAQLEKEEKEEKEDKENPYTRWL
jgi:hypothetical protein